MKKTLNIRRSFRPSLLIATAAAVVLLGVSGLLAACSDQVSNMPIGVASVAVTERVGDTSDAGMTSTSADPSIDTATSLQGADAAGASGAEYTATDDSYDSATTSVTLTEVSTGSGKNAVTYYVADVQLTTGTDLQSAFAEGFEMGNVDYTSSMAADNDAIVAINGDYCTARNTGIIIRNGVLYLDNPTREGLAIYQDGTMQVYDETEVTADQLLAGGVWNTFSFGPALVVDGTIPEGLDETEVEDIGEEHTILGSQPRTGVGIIDTNHYVFVVVDGRAAGYSVGMTLSDFAQVFENLGCTTAYNLDGGGSSAMYFMGRLVNDPLGKGRERGISDILYVGSVSS